MGEERNGERFGLVWGKGKGERGEGEVEEEGGGEEREKRGLRREGEKREGAGSEWTVSNCYVAEELIRVKCRLTMPPY